MRPLAAAFGAVVKVTRDSCPRGSTMTWCREVPGAPSDEPLGAAALMDPLDLAERTFVRVERPRQEVIPPGAYGAVRQRESHRQAGVAIHGRQRAAIGGGTGMLPVVAGVACVWVPRVSGFDRHR